MEYVYVIASSTTVACKVGRSNDPISRLSALQTGSPERLYLHLMVRVNNGPNVESQVKNQLSDRGKGMNGGSEWYAVGTREATAVMMAAIEFDDKEERLELSSPVTNGLLEAAALEDALAREVDPWERVLTARQDDLASLPHTEMGMSYNDIFFVLSVPVERRGPLETKRLSAVLKHMGWERRLIDTEKGRYWRYFPPEEVPA